MTLKLPCQISWCVPDEIKAAVDENNNILYPYVRIYRSTRETTGYDLVSADVVISDNKYPIQFVEGEFCRNLSFNKDFEIDTFLDSIHSGGNNRVVLLTLGSQEPEKVELFSIKDDQGGYRLCLDDNRIVYNSVPYGHTRAGWHRLHYNVGNLILNMTELPIAYVNPALTKDLVSNSINYDERNPYVENRVISEINSQYEGNWISNWTDPTIDIRNKDCYYYIVKYVTANKDYESKFYLTRKSLSPKEQRLVNHLKHWLSPWLTNCLTDDDLRAGIVFALESLNIKSPVTRFTIETLPQILESTLMVGSAIYSMMYKYLGIAFTDVSYSDNGVSITIDRGAKIQNAIDKATAYYDKLIDIAKLHYIQPGVGVGSIPLNISLGGRLPGNIMGALSNLFNAIGR